MHWVNKFEDGSFQSPRKSVTQSGYKSRTPETGVHLGKARVFNTIGAAKVSGANLDVTPVSVALAGAMPL